MFSKEESRQLRELFWTSYGKSFPRKWLLYNTKIKNVSLKFQADRKTASVCIDIEHEDEIDRLIQFEKFESLKSILESSSGFLYYVSITGITGTKISRLEDIKKKYLHLKKYIDLPFVIGFGINTPEKAKEIACYSDGVVVGSDIINNIEKSIKNNSNILDNVINLVKKYNRAVKSVKKL